MPRPGDYTIGEECPCCGGTGLHADEDFEEVEYECDACGGSGLIYYDSGHDQRERERREREERE